MNKKIFGLAAAVLFLTFCSGGPGFLGAQEKEQTKKDEKDKQKEKDAKTKAGVSGGVVGGSMGGVVGGVQGGIQGGVVGGVQGGVEAGVKGGVVGGVTGGIVGGVVGGVKGGIQGGVMGGVQGGVGGGVKGGVQGGVAGGIMSALIDSDFVLQPRKIIAFEIEHLLIKPTETIPLTKLMNMKTESGLKLNYSYSPPAGTKEEVGVEITPTIIENKGIELKIAILRNGQSVKEEKILSRNFEPVLVELMENKDEHTKLVDKITPLVEVLYPPQNYPKALDKLEMASYVLIMNDTLLINSTRGGSLSGRGGSEAEPGYLYFWIKGKGAYVLSFWPFEGAEPIGVVSDNAIRIRHGKDFFAWLSMKPVLPEGKWRVWVRNNPDYDPVQALQDPSYNLSPKDMEWLKARYQKENAAEAGIFGGRKGLERFFLKK